MVAINVAWTNNSDNDEHPVWSPDGRSIAFISNRFDIFNASYNIYVMDLRW